MAKSLFKVPSFIQIIFGHAYLHTRFQYLRKDTKSTAKGAKSLQFKLLYFFVLNTLSYTSIHYKKVSNSVPTKMESIHTKNTCDQIDYRCFFKLKDYGPINKNQVPAYRSIVCGHNIGLAIGGLNVYCNRNGQRVFEFVVKD